jgi:hypothetical protein
VKNVAYFLLHRKLFLTLFLLSPLHDEIYITPLLYLLILVGAWNKIPWLCSSFKSKEIY